MLYNYDDAIANDLKRSLNPDNMPNPLVKVIDPEKGLEAIAQADNDELRFPLVVLTRHQDTPIDEERWNFTRAHRGVAAVIDPETNLLYYEKAIPIKLSYDLTILATNSVDRDELAKELIFKYMSMYFITFTLPYECKRKVRFGVVIDENSDISNSSGTLEYIDEGKLYQTVMTLRCEGCVLVSYTPAKLKRQTYEAAIASNNEP